MSWSTLSEDLWKRILEYVPLEDRLRSCSVVNTTLHRAAAAATRAVTADDVAFSEQALPGLCQWMTHHGQHLTSLQLSGSGDEQLTQLPCPNLRQLDLAYIKVQLDSSSTPPGVLHSCTRLTWLRLDSCYFTNTDENYGSSLAALSALVELQHLALLENRDAGGSEWMPSTVLKQLPHLTYLRVRDQNVDMLGTRSLQHVSCLTKLQRLHLAGFRAQQRRVCLSPSTTPRLNRLTALRQVTLENVSLDPTILQDCTQLHVLKLLRVPIIAAGGAAARAAALHSLFDRLQHLQSLELHQLHRPAAAAAYTSLTASSALQALHLTVDDMPAGVWPHVFPPDRQLPALQELTLRWYHMDAWHPPPAAAMGTNDLGCITVCCRELRGISISVQPDTQLAALAKASGLTRLSVSGLYADGFQSLKALSGLVSLQELSVDLGGAITPSNLLCWTALRPLTRMSINPVMLPEFEGAYDVPLALAQVRSMLGSLPMSRSVARDKFSCGYPC